MKTRRGAMNIQQALSILRLDQQNTAAQDYVVRELSKHPYTGQDAFEEARNHIRAARYIEAAEILASTGAQDEATRHAPPVSPLAAGDETGEGK